MKLFTSQTHLIPGRSGPTVNRSVKSVTKDHVEAAGSVLAFIPLSLDVDMHILLTNLYILVMTHVGRICSNIGTFCLK